MDLLNDVQGLAAALGLAGNHHDRNHNNNHRRHRPPAPPRPAAVAANPAAAHQGMNHQAAAAAPAAPGGVGEAFLNNHMVRLQEGTAMMLRDEERRSALEVKQAAVIQQEEAQRQQQQQQTRQSPVASCGSSSAARSIVDSWKKSPEETTTTPSSLKKRPFAETSTATSSAKDDDKLPPAAPKQSNPCPPEWTDMDYAHYAMLHPTVLASLEALSQMRTFLELYEIDHSVEQGVESVKALLQQQPGYVLDLESNAQTHDSVLVVDRQALNPSRALSHEPFVAVQEVATTTKKKQQEQQEEEEQQQEEEEFPGLMGSSSHKKPRYVWSCSARTGTDDSTGSSSSSSSSSCIRDDIRTDAAETTETTTKPPAAQQQEVRAQPQVPNKTLRNVKNSDYNWTVLVRGHYYMYRACQPSLASIRQGIQWIVDCDGMTEEEEETESTDSASSSCMKQTEEYDQRLFAELLEQYPMKFQSIQAYNTNTLAANVWWGLTQRMWKKRDPTNFRRALQLGCRLVDSDASRHPRRRLAEIYSAAPQPAAAAPQYQPQPQQHYARQPPPPPQEHQDNATTSNEAESKILRRVRELLSLREVNEAEFEIATQPQALTSLLWQ